MAAELPIGESTAPTAGGTVMPPKPETRHEGGDAAATAVGRGEVHGRGRRERGGRGVGRGVEAVVTGPTRGGTT